MDIPSMTLGYDRAITIFSPEGRILQVEYARQAVEKGGVVIGIVTSEGVVIIADKKIHSKMIVEDSIEKIYVIDEHIISSFSGFIPDGRILLEKARVIAQEHKLTYGTPIDLLTLVKEIGDLKQMFTQYGGLRPFGVSLVFAGIDVDGKPKVFMTDPAGLYYQFYGVVIGEESQKISADLEKEYRKDWTIKDAIKFGINIIKRYINNEFTLSRINVAYIKKDDIKPVFLSEEDLAEYLEKESKEEAKDEEP